MCDDWVAVAEQLMGSPYRWGGRASTGLDCSALVQLSLAVAGKAVPRDSGPQHAIGYALDETDELQRGDLVFWRAMLASCKTGTDCCMPTRIIWRWLVNR